MKNTDHIDIWEIMTNHPTVCNNLMQNVIESLLQEVAPDLKIDFESNLTQVSDSTWNRASSFFTEDGHLFIYYDESTTPFSINRVVFKYHNYEYLGEIPKDKLIVNNSKEIEIRNEYLHDFLTSNGLNNQISYQISSEDPSIKGMFKTTPSGSITFKNSKNKENFEMFFSESKDNEYDISVRDVLEKLTNSQRKKLIQDSSPKHNRVSKQRNPI